MTSCLCFVYLQHASLCCTCVLKSVNEFLTLLMFLHDDLVCKNSKSTLAVTSLMVRTWNPHKSNSYATVTALCCQYKLNTSYICFKLKALLVFQWTVQVSYEVRLTKSDYCCDVLDVRDVLINTVHNHFK